ncbi:MAG TPA: hypothetical protein VG015_07685 [Candidatus Dormibacteraeota bacterium]|jgi:hypothetical protein|nr:hypothetical protein [Candidatus Dormibacteraeota bacterium]
MIAASHLSPEEVAFDKNHENVLFDKIEAGGGFNPKAYRLVKCPLLVIDCEGIGGDDGPDGSNSTEGSSMG